MVAQETALGVALAVVQVAAELPVVHLVVAQGVGHLVVAQEGGHRVAAQEGEHPVEAQEGPPLASQSLVVVAAAASLTACTPPACPQSPASLLASRPAAVVGGVASSALLLQNRSALDSASPVVRAPPLVPHQARQKTWCVDAPVAPGTLSTARPSVAPQVSHGALFASPPCTHTSR